MGKAIVTTDSPGCRESVVDGVNGILVPPRDAEALAKALEMLIMNPKLIVSMGRQSRALAESRFDVRIVNGEIMSALGVPDGHNGERP